MPFLDEVGQQPLVFSDGLPQLSPRRVNNGQRPSLPSCRRCACRREHVRLDVN